MVDAVPTRPAQRPEGRLIGAAAERDSRSVRQLAAKAGISDTRWRHIVTGSQPAGQGSYITVVAPAETLARMARVVGVTADELRQAGREDAADEMTSWGPTGAPDDEDLADAIKIILDDPDLTDEERDEYIQIVQADWERERGEARRRLAEKMTIRLEERRRRRAAG
jgi:Helix-turn-helix domain